MSSDRIKVVGYAKREFFGNGIEYRPFSPDLVGLQLASDGGTPLFTMGNFSITTNMEPKSNKFFVTNKFSNFITLTDLDLTLSQANTVLRNKSGVILNLDKNRLNNYALFGSLSEFMRVSLENIITTWPASLYITERVLDSQGNILNGNTYEDYSYDVINNISSFKINTTFINNKFQLNIKKNGSIIDTFNETNDLRNVTVYYSQYSILFNDIEYPLVNFTGSTYDTNDYIYLKVLGDPFSGLPTTNNIKYHIKPNKLKEETFFKYLSDFENHLLNRKTLPKYTADFKYSIKSEDGLLLYITESVTWPVSDGYNIDFDSSDYVTYASKLLDISSNNDLFTSDLMNRFLVSESISSFDTSPINMELQDTTGQKMTKTLHIYGRNFDDLNKYIEGISFANTVTYNKQNNIPDVYIKNLASVLGWELVSSIIENNLLSSYVTTNQTSYSGQTVGLTAIEADIELWRRLILNSPWLWKSKGSRKSVEFLLNFIGVPTGLITFNEYIYKTDAPIDMDLFRETLILNGLDDEDLSIYPVDSDGYPRPLTDTNDMYFQNYGLWYRETGGANSDIDILTGNNPHVGPYDGGYKYINQFRNFIPNFSAVTITSETFTSNVTKLFTNYGLGEITNYSGETYVNATYDDGSDIDECVIVTSSIINDPMPQPIINNCGCDNTPDSDDSLSICVKVIGGVDPKPCPNVYQVLESQTNLDGYLKFQYYTYDMNGNIIYDVYNNPVLTSSAFASKSCCKANSGIPTIYSEVNNGIVENTGYYCCKTANCGCFIACKWVLFKTEYINNEHYLLFKKQDQTYGVTTPDGSHCLDNYTTKIPNITDQYSGEIGIGCKLTQMGLDDLQLGTNGVMYNFYLSRSNGEIGCCAQNYN